VYGNPTQADMGGFRRPAATPSPAPVAPAYGDLVQQARRAFWNGDFEAAEHTYMDVVERYPDDADVYGELGNLYLAMGKNTLALDALFEAGVRLKALGEQQRALEVAEILTKKGDDRGRQLSANQ
jgi:tetratricopeptide (TPR) repeat protein